MSLSSCRRGGLDITWKIENFDCLIDGSHFKSPKFFIETFSKTEWTIEIVKNENPSHLIFYLNKEDAADSSDITIESYTSFSNDFLPQSKRNINQRIISYSSFKQPFFLYLLEDIKDISVGKTATIFCQLRNISCIDLVTHCCTFRTLIEAEYRNVRFILPNIKYCDISQDMFFPMISINSTSINFKLTLTVNKNKDININISKTEDNKETIRLHCKLSIENAKEETMLSSFNKYEFVQAGENTWKLPSCFEYKLFEKHLKEIKDFLYLNCELLISEHNCRTWMEEYKTNSCYAYKNQQKEIISTEKISLSDDLMCLYVEQKCPDVEISVDGRRFPVHKSILSSRSPVFSAMFDNNMLEKKKNQVEISDLDADTVDKMIFFIYSDIVREEDWRTMVKLLVAADKYQILTLKDKCFEYLKKQLSVENICEALVLSDRLHNSDLLSSVQDYAVSNSKNLFSSEEWRAFMANEAKLACETMHRVFLNK